MYKMFLKICESSHLKLFKGIQLRLMIPLFLRLGPPPVRSKGLHEEYSICPRKQ